MQKLVTKNPDPMGFFQKVLDKSPIISQGIKKYRDLRDILKNQKKNCPRVKIFKNERQIPIAGKFQKILLLSLPEFFIWDLFAIKIMKTRNLRFEFPGKSHPKVTFDMVVTSIFRI